MSPDSRKTPLSDAPTPGVPLSGGYTRLARVPLGDGCEHRTLGGGCERRAGDQLGGVSERRPVGEGCERPAGVVIASTRQAGGFATADDNLKADITA